VDTVEKLRDLSNIRNFSPDQESILNGYIFAIEEWHRKGRAFDSKEFEKVVKRAREMENDQQLFEAAKDFIIDFNGIEDAINCYKYCC
jgi:hypothetical protein